MLQHCPQRSAGSLRSLFGCASEIIMCLVWDWFGIREEHSSQLGPRQSKSTWGCMLGMGAAGEHRDELKGKGFAASRVGISQAVSM